MCAVRWKISLLNAALPRHVVSDHAKNKTVTVVFSLTDVMHLTLKCVCRTFLFVSFSQITESFPYI
jgi:hypothetical protein